jgi:hypothetical protein
MCITGKVLEDLLGSSKGWLDVDDPITGAKAVIASFIPARRASKVDPILMLGHE